MIVGVLSHRESGHVEKVSAFFIKKTLTPSKSEWCGISGAFYVGVLTSPWKVQGQLLPQWKRQL
mgnify:FL=1